MSKKVWQECEECDGEGGHWIKVYPPRPKTEFDPSAEVIKAWSKKLWLETMKTTKLNDLLDGKK